MGKVTNVVIAGLGGQGVLSASDVLAEAAFRAGFDVKKAEVHGMSQRGGSVSTDVRFGDRVLSPMVPHGEADFLVVLEETQVEPTKHYLRSAGVLLTPSMLDVQKLPSAKALNVGMLGLLSTHVPIPDEAWMDALRASFAEKLHEGNEKAFQLGKSAASAKGGDA